MLVALIACSIVSLFRVWLQGEQHEVATAVAIARSRPDAVATQAGISGATIADACNPNPAKDTDRSTPSTPLEANVARMAVMLPAAIEYHDARLTGEARYLITANTSIPPAAAARFSDQRLVRTPSCLIVSRPRMSAGIGAQRSSR